MILKISDNNPLSDINLKKCRSRVSWDEIKHYVYNEPENLED